MIDDMAVYIANLGKYNEGYLVGEMCIRDSDRRWHKCIKSTMKNSDTF